MTERLFKIRGAVQPYDWGGYSYIRALLGLSAKPESPSAEYWLGTHPNAPSTALLDSGEVELSSAMARLGQSPLSFLMKILDVRMMLSIQVHPTIPQAQEGYAREDRAGIPLSSGNRTYRDRNHKPELMFALGRFWMLHGLRPEEELKRDFSNRPSCSPLLDILSGQGLKGLVSAVLRPDDPVIRQVVDRLLREISEDSAPTDKSCHEFWIQRWLEDNPGVHAGILMILLMNIIELQPGEAVYQPARLLHAYLEGRNIEIMANSDNVLRAGLTSKHIDAAELVRITGFEPTDPRDFMVNVPRDEKGIRRFDTPFDDFLLQEAEVGPFSDLDIPSGRSRILLFLAGERLGIRGGQAVLDLIPGESCFCCADQSVTLSNRTSRTAQVFIGS